MKRGRLNLNRTGYTKGTETAKNPYNIIPSDTISMRNVEHNIYAIPVDKNGKAGERTLLKPGDVKKFDGAKYVIEIPEENIQNAQVGLNNLPFTLSDYGAQTTEPSPLTPEAAEEIYIKYLQFLKDRNENK